MSHPFCRNLGKVTQNVVLFAKSRGPGASCLKNSNLPKLAVVNSQLQTRAAFSTSRNHRGAAGPTTSGSSNDDIDPTNVTGKKKYWRTLGFNWHDEKLDQLDFNYVMFVTVTIGVVGIGFLFAYLPEFRLKDWSQREAYIEIARREALGLPYIDPNVVPPEKINLPTEEELGDFEIII